MGGSEIVAYRAPERVDLMATVSRPLVVCLEGHLRPVEVDPIF